MLLSACRENNHCVHQQRILSPSFHHNILIVFNIFHFHFFFFCLNSQLNASFYRSKVISLSLFVCISCVDMTLSTAAGCSWTSHIWANWNIHTPRLQKNIFSHIPVCVVDSLRNILQESRVLILERVWPQTATQSNLISWRKHPIQFTGWVITASQGVFSFGFLAFFRMTCGAVQSWNSSSSSFQINTPRGHITDCQQMARRSWEMAPHVFMHDSLK